MKNYYVSIETTGLHPLKDDLTEIAILNDAAEIVYHSVVDPIRDSGTFPESEITAAMRETAPKWGQIEPKVRQILHGNRVFVWDLLFTTSFLMDTLAKERVDVQSWFTKRADKYPASLRGTSADYNLWCWTWEQRCVFKCKMIIGCLNRWVNDYWERKALKANESRKDIFWLQWTMWNRISMHRNNDADKRRYTKWILGYEPITKTFFGQLFSRYLTSKGYVCARVDVQALQSGVYVVFDTVGWLKDEKKIAKITDWLKRNNWIQMRHHYKTPLTKEWKAVMKALKHSNYDEVCYEIFLENINHVK